MATSSSRLTPEQQAAILYWPYTANIPIIPCQTYPKKEVHLGGWNNIDFSQIDFNAKLANGEYDNGIALVLGKTLPGGLYSYSFALDFDGWDAVLEWFDSWERVLDLSKKTRVEWHRDNGRIHCIFLSKKNRPVANRKINIKGSLLEVRCEKQLLFASPSIHPDGNPYTPLGTNEIAILDEHQLLMLESKIDVLSEGYMSDENKQEYIRWLEDPNTKLGEDEGRHPALVTLGTSYFYRYTDEWRDMTDDQRRAKLWEWNTRQKVPKPEKEFNLIWKWILDTHRKTRDERNERLEDERRKAAEDKENFGFGVKLDDNIRQELEGNILYNQIQTANICNCLRQNKNAYRIFREKF